MNENKDSTIAVNDVKRPEDCPLIVCVAECIGDVARFLLRLEGRPGAVMIPVITQPTWTDVVRVTFRSTVPLAILRSLAESIPDCHRISESLAQMAGARR
jgi:hypothetical protein